LGTTREHAVLAYTLGIRQLIVGVNKMDACNFSEKRFKELEKSIREIMAECKFKDAATLHVIPYSGFEGDNLMEPSDNMKWYKGKTLLEALNTFKAPERPIGKPLRLPIQDIYKIGGIGTVPVGRVESGVIKPGMSVVFSPSGKTAEVKSVEKHCASVDCGEPGDNVGFNVKIPVNEIKKGHVCSDSKNSPASGVNEFEGTVVILNHPNSIKPGYCPIIDCHTAHIACQFHTLINVKNKRTKAIEPNPSELKVGDTGSVKFKPSKTIVVEPFTLCPPLGRFAVRDMKKTVAVGIVTSVTPGIVQASKK